MFDLPHAETHAVVLPYVLALNAPAVPDLDRRMAAALGADSALAGLLALRDELGAPTALRDLGLRADDVPEAVQPILDAAPPNNPTPVTPANVEALLRAAWEGTEPR
jgi:alcohol dehydrogenase class IV